MRIQYTVILGFYLRVVQQGLLFSTLQDVILGALRQILPQDQPLHALEIASGSYQSFNPRPEIDHSILYLLPIINHRTQCSGSTCFRASWIRIH
jgi:hypothetical protein